MRKLLSLAVAGLALGLGACVHLEPTAKQELLVVSRGTLELHRIDPVTGAILASAKTNNAPHEVAASPDGRFAYLPIYGDGNLGRPGSNGGVIQVVDVDSMRQLTPIDLGAGVRPHGIEVDREGFLWVTAELARQVLVIDTRSSSVIARIPTGQDQSHNLALSPDGRRAYTSNVSSGSISVIDAKAHRLITTIPVASRIQRVSVSPDSRWVFTHDTTAPRLAVIDARTNRIARWIPLPRAGYASAPTPDGRRLLVASPSRQADSTGRGLSRLFVVDLARWAVIAEVDTGCAPIDLTVSPDSRRAFLSCGDGFVAPVDLEGLKPLGQIRLQQGIDGIELARSSG